MLDCFDPPLIVPAPPGAGAGPAGLAVPPLPGLPGLAHLMQHLFAAGMGGGPGDMEFFLNIDEDEEGEEEEEGADGDDMAGDVEDDMDDDDGMHEEQEEEEGAPDLLDSENDEDVELHAAGPLAQEDHGALAAGSWQPPAGWLAEPVLPISAACLGLNRQRAEAVRNSIHAPWRDGGKNHIGCAV